MKLTTNPAAVPAGGVMPVRGATPRAGRREFAGHRAFDHPGGLRVGGHPPRGQLPEVIDGQFAEPVGGQ